MLYELTYIVIQYSSMVHLRRGLARSRRTWCCLVFHMYVCMCIYACACIIYIYIPYVSCTTHFGIPCTAVCTSSAVVWWNGQLQTTRTYMCIMYIQSTAVHFTFARIVCGMYVHVGRIIYIIYDTAVIMNRSNLCSNEPKVRLLSCHSAAVCSSVGASCPCCHHRRAPSIPEIPSMTIILLHCYHTAGLLCESHQAHTNL